MHIPLTQECSWPCYSPFPTTQDIAENGCSAAPEEPLPRTAPSPLGDKKDPKFREDRRPITVHFGQVGLSVKLFSIMSLCKSSSEKSHNNTMLSLVTELCYFSFISVVSVSRSFQNLIFLEFADSFCSDNDFEENKLWVNGGWSINIVEIL